MTSSRLPRTLIVLSWLAGLLFSGGWDARDTVLAVAVGLLWAVPMVRDRAKVVPPPS